MSPKARDRYINKRIKFWRSVLGIDDKLRLRVKYVTHRDEDEERNYATISKDMAEYRRATMEIYDEVFASRDFKKDAHESICHEIIHLALHPLIAYCHNMFTGDEGKQAELSRLEEVIVTIFEEALTELSPHPE